MTAARRGCLKCRRCGVTLTANPRGAARRFDIESRPDCPACGHRMAVNGGKGFSCYPCRTRRRRLRQEPDACAALLAQIADALPAYLAPDERDDAAQQVMLDVLAAKLPPVAPEARTLRRYARAARGMVSDRHRFISLSQPTRDGRTFGELIAA